MAEKRLSTTINSEEDLKEQDTALIGVAEAESRGPRAQ
jgi:hypothetical protein